jgi:hypothetical protein
LSVGERLRQRRQERLQCERGYGNGGSAFERRWFVERGWFVERRDVRCVWRFGVRGNVIGGRGERGNRKLERRLSRDERRGERKWRR